MPCDEPHNLENDNTDNTRKIISLELSGVKELPEKHLLRRDRDIALRDILHNNYFKPQGDEHGPYSLEISIENGRLVFKIKNAKEQDLPMLVLSPKPYKRLIQDYFMIVNSYDAAIREGKPSKIEAIDMGRRGLHNEGASLLKERLEDKIDMDFDTSRRLFTLICILHARMAVMWRS